MTGSRGAYDQQAGRPAANRRCWPPALLLAASLGAAAAAQDAPLESDRGLEAAAPPPAARVGDFQADATVHDVPPAPDPQPSATPGPAEDADAAADSAAAPAALLKPAAAPEAPAGPPPAALPPGPAILARAAAAGDPDAQIRLARRYRDGDGVPQSYDKATALLERAAAQDHVPALYLLASHYRVGLGVDQDLGRAVALFTRAAERGHVVSAHRLGRLYEAGGGVSGDGALPPDRDKALSWYIFGHQRGCAPCTHSAGLMLLAATDDPAALAAGIDWLTRAANAAHAPAQLLLAQLLADGRPDLPADPVEAYKWATLAAVQDAPAAAALREALSQSMTPEQRVQARNRIADWRPVH